METDIDHVSIVSSIAKLLENTDSLICQSGVWAKASGGGGGISALDAVAINKAMAGRTLECTASTAHAGNISWSTSPNSFSAFNYATGDGVFTTNGSAGCYVSGVGSFGIDIAAAHKVNYVRGVVTWDANGIPYGQLFSARGDGGTGTSSIVAANSITNSTIGWPTFTNTIIATVTGTGGWSGACGSGSGGNQKTSYDGSMGVSVVVNPLTQIASYTLTASVSQSVNVSASASVGALAQCTNTATAQ